MTSSHTYDPALYGAWPETPAYADDDMPEAAPEIKSRADRLAAEDAARNGNLRQLLNELTEEMRQQFSMYRNMREAGEAGLLPDADDAQAKQARADVKIATDQLSLIVRTLERIDALQRVLAQERQALMAEDETETEDYEAAVAHFLGRIDDLAEQKCRERLEAIAALGTSVGSG
ncbi:hypothetical protein EN41_16395 [Agrobacterium tumefaciens]|uniref:Uncharacterized protein n=1 Tax=Agrobacterium fabrum (strain C58 / ATCC 33970) TaxID=176299 RepID=Q8U5G9_AGRFC|nr:hypothetical protein [Agrobacterium fabrum]KEY55351.1 hypothetical protein EN41_16395 [Agrobacterium tumefaciens]AAK86756.2 hypothetical protein Atu8088 [Agrobacterium fabrum str. C58]MCX2874212.1 hypothetical protein [Agrobacterium fabrum]NMV68369.1 hypothetical protein [Agrobacterium fabrum]QQN06317.1 hypothetical protein EML4058_03135 [Agrobacterium fabrum]